MTKRVESKDPIQVMLDDVKATLNSGKPIPEIIQQIQKDLNDQRAMRFIVARITPLLQNGTPVNDILKVVKEDLEKQKLVDLFIEMDLWDLFEVAQEQGVRVEDQINLLPEISAELLALLTAERPALLAQINNPNTRLEAFRAIATAPEDAARITPPPAITDPAAILAFKNREMNINISLKNALASAYKETTLRLFEERYPEATRADRETKHSKHPMLALYGRILKLFFSFEKFWGMGRWQRIGFYTSAVLCLAGGVALITTSGLWAPGTILIAMIPLGLPPIWGFAPWRDKIFFGAIGIGGISYVFGFLVYHLLKSFDIEK